MLTPEEAHIERLERDHAALIEALIELANECYARFMSYKTDDLTPYTALNELVNKYK